METMILAESSIASSCNAATLDFESLVNAHGRFVFHMAYAVLRNSEDAEDVAPTDKGIQADASTPVFRSITINAKAPLSLGKATTVGSVEDPTSKHRFQVEATATKLK
jgi:hypothetical protein